MHHSSKIKVIKKSPNSTNKSFFIFLLVDGRIRIWIRNTNLKCKIFLIAEREQKSHMPGFLDIILLKCTFFSQAGAEACFRSPFPDGGASVEVHKVSRISLQIFSFESSRVFLYEFRELAMEVSFPFLCYM